MTLRLTHVAVLAAVTVTLTGLPSAAYAALPAATPVSVTVSLRPGDPARLASAARLPKTTSPTRRRDEVSAAAPSEAARQRTRAVLPANGLRVTFDNGWVLSATGTVRDTKRALAARLRAALGADALSVDGLDQPMRMRHHALPPGAYTPSDLRRAYEVPAAGTDGAGVTIATVQFSGWNRTDLDRFALDAGIPIAAGQVTEIAVNGADPRFLDAGGEVEVAMDQEILLGAAPKANQRIYITRNGAGDEAAVLSRIADDVDAAGVDVVSDSWGICEPEIDQFPAAKAAQDVQLQRIVALGATFFVASGDYGGFGCATEDAPDRVPAVDWPSASVHSVAVGGTHLTPNGSSFDETAWSEPNPVATEVFAGRGSGGGTSSNVVRPGYQHAGLPSSGGKRMVPDVAAIADPNDGIAIYVETTKSEPSDSGYISGGGTSASAPLWAGHLAAALSAAGRTVGLGDIHQVLYDNAVGFRDITSGTNFIFDAGVGYDQVTGLGSPRWNLLGPILTGSPQVIAPGLTRSLTIALEVTPPRGFTFTAWTVGEGPVVGCSASGTPQPPSTFTFPDGADRRTRVTVSGRDTGGTCHSGTAAVTIDRTAPGNVRPVITALTGKDQRTRFSWSAADGTSGVTSFAVSIIRVPSTTAFRNDATTASSVSLTLSVGYTYVMTVSAVDAAGNRSAPASATYAVPFDESHFSRSSGWARGINSNAWYGAHTSSSVRNASMARTMNAKSYALIYTAGVGNGYVDVYVNNIRVKRLDLFASTTQFRREVLVYRSDVRANRTIKLVVVGARRVGSRGNAVYIDGFRATA